MYVPFVGDSFGRIKALFNADIDRILAANDMKKGDVLEFNKVLFVPDVVHCACRGPEAFQGRLRGEYNKGALSCSTPKLVSNEKRFVKTPQTTRKFKLPLILTTRRPQT